jgi:hypothetical protein
MKRRPASPRSFVAVWFTASCLFWAILAWIVVT